MSAPSAVLDPTDLLFDMLHYHHKCHPAPSATGLWPLGTTCAPEPKGKSTAGNTSAIPPLIAPSKAAILRDFAAIDGYQTHLPLFKPHTRAAVALLREAWQRALPGGSHATSETVPPPDLSTIPLSTVEHDNTQLRWHRPGVPLCDYGDECDALSLYGNQGPLHAYLTPAQQQAFDGPTQHLPEGPYFCLLCIRRDLHALHLAHAATCHPTLQTNGRPVLVLPPFQNIVDAPGGYIRSAMVNGAEGGSFLPVPVSVVGVSGTLTVKYDPVAKRWFIDQGAIIYQGQNSGVPLGADFH
jgi:hypothetical protein